MRAPDTRRRHRGSIASESEPMDVAGCGQHGAQVILGAAVGDHQYPVFAPADKVQRRSAGSSPRASPISSTVQPDQSSIPAIDEHDLDLVPAEEEARSPSPRGRAHVRRVVASRAHDRGRAAVLRPFRQQLRQVRGTRDIRIDVRRRRRARRGAGPVDELEGPRHLAPVPSPGHREVRHLQPAARVPRDVEDLLHASMQPVVVVAHVRREEPVVLAPPPADRLQLRDRPKSRAGTSARSRTPSAPSSTQPPDSG